jgi:hypothetical protein
MLRCVERQGSENPRQPVIQPMSPTVDTVHRLLTQPLTTATYLYPILLSALSPESFTTRRARFRVPDACLSRASSLPSDMTSRGCSDVKLGRKTLHKPSFSRRGQVFDRNTAERSFQVFT